MSKHVPISLLAFCRAQFQICKSFWHNNNWTRTTCISFYHCNIILHNLNRHYIYHIFVIITPITFAFRFLGKFINAFHAIYETHQLIKQNIAAVSSLLLYSTIQKFFWETLSTMYYCTITLGQIDSGVFLSGICTQLLYIHTYVIPRTCLSGMEYSTRSLVEFPLKFATIWPAMSIVIQVGNSVSLSGPM